MEDMYPMPIEMHGLNIYTSVFFLFKIPIFLKQFPLNLFGIYFGKCTKFVIDFSPCFYLDPFLRY